MISRIADAVTTVEGLAFILGLCFGVGALCFVSVSWLHHFASTGHYISFSIVAICTGFFALGAVLRVPLALAGVFGSAAVIASAYGIGVQGMLLP